MAIWSIKCSRYIIEQIKEGAPLELLVAIRRQWNTTHHIGKNEEKIESKQRIGDIIPSYSRRKLGHVYNESIAMHSRF